MKLLDFSRRCKVKRRKNIYKKNKKSLPSLCAYSSKDERTTKKIFKIRGTCETDHLFVTLEQTAMSRDTLQKIVAIYGKKAGIKGVRCSPHTFSHTFAKRFVMNGAGVFELQKILGHSTMEMVRLYVNLYSSEISEKHRDFSPLNNL